MHDRLANGLSPRLATNPQEQRGCCFLQAASLKDKGCRLLVGKQKCAGGFGALELPSRPQHPQPGANGPLSSPLQKMCFVWN